MAKNSEFRSLKRLTIVLLSAFLVAADPQLTFEQVVEKCVKVVRSLHSYSRFDAYVTSKGYVSYFGSAEEQFQFEKCMNQNGHPLKGER